MLARDTGSNLSNDEKIVVLFFGMAFGLALGSAFYLSFRQKGGGFAGNLSLEQDVIRWRPVEGQIVEVPYAALWTASLVGRDGSEALILKAQQKELDIVVAKKSLASPDLAETLLEEILDRVRKLPEGQQLHARLENRQALAKRLATGQRIVVPAIASILMLVFLLEVGVGALEDPTRLLSLGANSPELVAKAEWFRLATSNLLHGGIAHLAANLFALLVLGFFLEPLLGRGRLLTIFLTTAIAGAALSSWVGQHDISVGASTGLLGLYAADVIVSWRWRDQLLGPPANKWKSLFWILFVLFSGGEQVDRLGHLGGFIAGCLLMIPALKEADLLKLHLRNRLLFRVASSLLVAVFLLACTMIPLVRFAY